MTNEKRHFEMTLVPTASATSPAPDGTSSKNEEPTASGAPQVVINVRAEDAKNGTAEILDGIAAIVWPIVIIIIILTFRSQIGSLLSRLRKGKAFGAEAEFEEDLEALNREANKAKKELAGTTPATTASSPSDANPAPRQMAGWKVKGDNLIQLKDKVLAETRRSPRLGLLLISAEIDKLSRKIAASTGHLDRSTLREQLQLWDALLPPHTLEAFRLFERVRNRIIHGAEASEPEIVSAIDSGTILYEALASMPIEENVVEHSGVEIFGDPGAINLLEGKGVILHSEAGIGTQIHPTTQEYYTPGMHVTWEWNMGRRWGPAWYRDPETGEIRQAWDASAEFVGRDLSQV